jgi:hypothetical protein
MLAESTELASIESKRIYSKRKITGKKKRINNFLNANNSYETICLTMILFSLKCYLGSITG